MYLGNSPIKMCMFSPLPLLLTCNIISKIDANVQTLNLNRPNKFFKSTNPEARFQTFQILLQRHSLALNVCSGAVHTHSKAFTHTQYHLGGVQYSLKGIHTHSITFRSCSILTQSHSFSWSHHGKSHSIMTQWHSHALNGRSHSLN